MENLGHLPPDFRHSRRAQKKLTQEKANYFYFNSSSRRARKRRSGSCRARASAFS
jgi:hypothetical protein